MHVTDLELSDVEVRVLGSLVEKDITTPDYYPLSLNALLNACNQKNNRDPLMLLEENQVREALSSLANRRLAGPAGGADSRVTKYEHRLQEAFNFDRREIALLCVLWLRGAQTPGELRGRSERMYRFETLDDVQSVLERLMHRDPPLVRMLARQPGTKESRYRHLFSPSTGDESPPVVAAPITASPGGRLEEKVAALEHQVSQLRKEIDDLRGELRDFKQQF